MLLDLHTHTNASHDGITTQQQLLDACVVRGINVLAITEHDKYASVDAGAFSARGITIIPGCEFTTDKGAHIIGLWVSDAFPAGNSRESILRHIKQSGGLAIMPHPMKPGSGYLEIYQEDECLRQFDFMELVNGGWRAKGHWSRITELAEKYNIRLIASSDSHRLDHVGMCATRLESGVHGLDLKEALMNCRQQDLKLMIDQSLFSKQILQPNILQRAGFYKYVISVVPYALRQAIKRRFHALRKKTVVKTPNFVEISLDVPSW